MVVVQLSIIGVVEFHLILIDVGIKYKESLVVCAVYLSKELLNSA